MTRARSYPRRRLALLVGLLLLAVGALVAQRSWFSEEARAARLERMNLGQLEKEAARSADPSVQYRLARRKLEVGDAGGAQEALEMTLRLDPRFPGARAALASLLVSEDQYQPALLQLQQEIRDHPEGVE